MHYNILLEVDSVICTKGYVSSEMFFPLHCLFGNSLSRRWARLRFASIACEIEAQEGFPRLSLARHSIEHLV